MTASIRLLILSALVASASSLVLAGGEIHGTITTRSGESFTGPIRWDKNENYWDDRLDAVKERVETEKKKGFSLNIFGVELARIGGDSTRTMYAFSVPFGHIESIEPRHPNPGVDVTLKNGDTHRVRSSSSDLGSAMRSLIIADAEAGDVDLDWSEIKRIEFRQAPAGPGRDAQRLYGTVEAGGRSFVGFVVWDRDESMLEDRLDGDDHEFNFEEIKKIERLGSRGSRVTLQDDRVVEMSGTNDVDDGHRGVVVLLPGVGTVEMDWEDFDQVTFSKPPASATYDEFDGGAKLSGTVHGREGSWSGRIIWDDDEEFSWETLDGEIDGFDYAIPFSRIRSIRRVDSTAAEVELVGGQRLTLTGSNDVDEDNRGIIVIPDGKPDSDDARITLEWGDLKSVELN